MKEVPAWLVAIVVGALLIVLAVVAYRNFMQTPVTYVTPEKEKLLEERMREAFEEGKIPKGMKVVPPSPPPVGR